MEVNDALINKLASLAKLNFSEEERITIKADLKEMITFITKMEEVNTDHVEPLLHITSTVNVLRPDEVGGTCSREEALKNAPVHNDSFFMVPKMIKKER